MNVRDAYWHFLIVVLFSHARVCSRAPRRRADRRAHRWRKAAPRPRSASEPCASTAVPPSIAASPAAVREATCSRWSTFPTSIRTKPRRSKGIEVAAHRGAVQRGLGSQTRDGQRTKASELAQDGELGDAQPRGRQSRIIGGGDRARGAAERGASTRCLELHSRVYTPFLVECKPMEPCSGSIQFGRVRSLIRHDTW